MPASTVAFIVRNEREISAALAEVAEPFFLCADERLLDTCREKGYSCRLLDEDLIGGQFQAINAWVYGRTLDFVERFADDRMKYLFFQSNFTLIQRLFVQTLKNCLVVDKMVNDLNIDKVGLFDDGTSLLALSCKEYFRQHRPDVVFSCLSQPDCEKRRVGGSFKVLVGRFVGPVINAVNYQKLKKISKKNKRILLASGGLNHLSPVLTQLQKKYSYGVVYVEQAFNLEKLNYCRANGMVYILVPKAKTPFDPFALAPLEFAAGELIYGDLDYSSLFSAVFNAYFKQGKGYFSYDPKRIEALYARCSFDAVLLDEDMAMRRMIGVFSDKGYFVISHGVPAGLPEESSLKGVYSSGKTFVNGEFEKQEYERLYYDKRKVAVTGVPRYDRLVRLKRSMPGAGPMKRVLHCGAGMRPFGFEDEYTILGLKNFLGQYSERYLKDLLQIMGGRKDARLIIKPHYQEEVAWDACIKRHAPAGAQAELKLHNDDTFQLEAEADVVVTVESSVICEAIMLDKPVIVLNYTKNGLLSNYEKYGLVEHVRDRVQLEKSLEKCLHDGAYLKALSERRREHFAYFAGHFDGNNAGRAAEVIACAKPALTGNKISYV